MERFLAGNGSLNSLNDPKVAQKKSNAGRKKKEKQQTQIEEGTYFENSDGGIFCICKKPYEGQTDMIEC